MSYVRGSSDIRSYSYARRMRALNFADRYRFPI
jgi:hypothetical protein